MEWHQNVKIVITYVQHITSFQTKSKTMLMYYLLLTQNITIYDRNLWNIVSYVVLIIRYELFDLMITFISILLFMCKTIYCKV